MSTTLVLSDDNRRGAGGSPAALVDDAVALALCDDGGGIGVERVIGFILEEAKLMLENTRRQ